MHAILGRLPLAQAELFVSARENVELELPDNSTWAYLYAAGVGESCFARLRAELAIFSAPPIPLLGEKINEQANFCWIYWSGEDEADEIRWSIRSTLKYYRGDATITVIGDRPSGFKGHVILQPRVPPQRFRAYRDTLNKLLTLIRSPEIGVNRVWMMDDTYYTRPFTLQDIAVPLQARSTEVYGTGDWRQLQLDTIRAVEAAGQEYVNYVAHCPTWLDVDKMEDTVQRFRLEREALIWESCYGVLHFPVTDFVDAAVLRVQQRKVTAPDCERSRSRLVLNHSHNCWSAELAAWLSIDLAGYGQELFDDEPTQ